MKKLSEADIIRFLANDVSLPSNVFGIGDDAAVIHRGDYDEIITKDLLIENQHFRLHYSTPAELAKKALHVNLSDIAAMGGVADYIFLGLSVPLTLSPEWLEAFLHHVQLECQHENVYLLGGDTTYSPHGLTISITVIGHGMPSSIKYRHHAKVSDVVCLLGFTGDAHAGLLLLEKNIPDFESLKKCSLAPTALTKEGRWLGAQPAVTAMMDTSDGIFIDLKHLCDASRVGAILNIDALPLSPQLQLACDRLQIAPIECALIGGEDYGLLFTVKQEMYHVLHGDFIKQFDTPFNAIGIVTNTGHLELKEHGELYHFNYKPFSHFNENI